MITLTNNRVAHGTPNSGAGAARTLVKITRILFEKRWEYCPGKKRGHDDIGVSGAKAFAVALRTLPKFRIFVTRLLKSREESRAQNGDGITARLPCQSKLQFCGKGRGVGMKGNVKVREHSKDALVDLLFHLFSGHFHGVHHHFDVGDNRGNGKNNGRHQKRLSWG